MRDRLQQIVGREHAHRQAVFRSLWARRRVRQRNPKHAAAKVVDDPQNTRIAARSHDRATPQRLQQLGINPNAIRACLNL